MVESVRFERLEVESGGMVPIIDRKTILKEVKSGTISAELGADGTYLRFDCDCLDALPICKAQCCALIGTIVTFDEMNDLFEELCDFHEGMKAFLLKRDSDGFCTCLDRTTRRCTIYEDRPNTCQEYHCTRGVGNRGWKLANSVTRQSMS